MKAQTKAPQPQDAESLRRKLDEYERWFRTLDRQIRLLERERQKFSAVVNHTDAGFIVVDASMKVVWANEIFREEFGGVRDSNILRGLQCNQVLCGEDELCERCPAPRPFRFGTVAHHEMSLEIQGRIRHVYATAMPIKSPEGKVEQCIIMLQDVSDLQILRESEQALRTSEERFRSIFENVASGMHTCKTDGSFVQVNPAFCKMLGYTESELLQTKDVCAVTHPDDLDETRGQLDEVLAGGRRVMELEKRYVRKDGETVWGRTTAVWLVDEQGEPTYAVVLVQDITQRKQAEHDLLQSQQDHAALVNSIDGIVWECDARTFKFSFISKQAERILGYPVQRWLEEPEFWKDHIHPDDRADALHYCVRSTAEKRDHEFDYRMIAVDGREVWLRDTVSVVVENGEAAKLRGIMVDISERKRAQEVLRQREEQLRQSQKMEAIGRLAGGIAHDFNNLLTAITGYSQFLLERLGPDSPLRREATEIRSASDKAAALTSQLLAFSRRQVLQPKVLHLSEVVGEMDRMLRRVIGEDIDLVTVMAPDLGYVRADPGQMQQVLLNLAVNARDAMPEGGKITIDLSNAELDEQYARQHPGTRPGSYVLLSFSDNGCGMDPETQAKLFEPFFTTKGQGEGTGLGLSTVYGIVKQSDGNIWVSSEPGRGTTFKTYLPRLAEPEVTAPQPREEPVAVARGTETVLMVEDDDAVRGLAEEILEDAGYTVLVACDGQEALALSDGNEEPIDLLVTDLVMPGMGGAELARTLAPQRPEMKVLFTSGYTDNAAFHQGLLDEGSHFMQKPFTPETLETKVREILDGTAANAQPTG